MKKETYKTLAIVTIFSIAMAFLESVVVVYLRKIYYPDGFNFPLVGFIEPSILNIEWAREFFTLIMLACLSILAGKKFYGKFAYFFYSFAIWDIFYYIWLKLILNWPSSFLTWDLLFLIPWQWTGPVLAPLILSITMGILALCILHCQDKGINVKLNAKEWLLLIAGSLIVLYTFLIDYGKLIFESGATKDFFTFANNPQFIQTISSYIPISYNWLLFTIGEILLILVIVFFYIRNRKLINSL